MRKLTKKAIGEILAYDLKHHRKRDGAINRTRFYHYLGLSPNDVIVRTVAVKADRKGNVHVKEVFRSSVTSTRMRILDLAFTFMGGYSVDWSNELAGHPRKFNYDGIWGIETYTHKNNWWKLNATTVNPGILAEAPNFKYCAFTDACGHPLDYLKFYVEQPHIELLVKAGLTHFAMKRTFANRVSKNKQLARFIFDNLKRIKRHHYNTAEICRAFSKHTKLETARNEILTIRRFDGAGKLPGINKLKAAAYAQTNDIELTRYVHYLHLCQRFRLALTDTKNSYPHKFEERLQVLQETADAEDRAAEKAQRIKNAKEQAALRRTINRRIRETAAAFAKVEDLDTPYCVRLPRVENDLRKEGKALNHCVGRGSHAAQIARGQTAIAFVRDPKYPHKPMVTVSFSLSANRIEQCYGNHNATPPKELIDFVYNRLQKQLTKINRRARHAALPVPA
jgi:hypothetical protein